MKKRLSIILIACMLMINICTPVYASSNFFPEVSPNVPESYTKARDLFMQIVSDVGQVGMLPITGLQVMVTEFLNALGLNNEAEEIQDENDAFQWLNEGINVNGDNVSITGRQYQFIKYYCQQNENNYGFRYWYTLRIADHGSPLTSQNFQTLVGQYQKDYYILVYSNYQKVMCIPKQYTQLTYRSSTGSGGAYVNLTDIRTGSSTFNDGCLNFTNFSNTGSTSGVTGGVLVNTSESGYTGGLSDKVFMISNQYEPLTVFNAYSGVSCNQVAPYYTTGSYNTNITKDSYNTTKSNIDNSLTSNDVYNYVNNYYDSNNGTYPTPNQINVHIENITTNNNSNNNNYYKTYN